MIEREDQYRFQVMGDMNADGSWLSLMCERCPWSAAIEDPVTLAELIDAASEHAEACR